MPPIAPRLISALRRRYRPKQVLTVAEASALIEAAHWIEKAPLRLLLPPTLLRMQGAFAYGPAHPFVQALRDGKDALARFYADLQPTGLADYYGIPTGGRTGHDLPPWEVPWYLRQNRTPPPGELSLGPEHGVSFYGPASAQKVDLEYSRLTGLRETLLHKGYDPDGHGDIEGYILRDGDAACFFVRGGKHRAAVLTALGHEAIPVSFRTSFPRVVDASQSAFWPLVRSGQIEPSLARDILSVYVSGRNITQDHSQ